MGGNVTIAFTDKVMKELEKERKIKRASTVDEVVKIAVKGYFKMKEKESKEEYFRELIQGSKIRK